MVKGNKKGGELDFDLSRVQIPQKYIYPIPLPPSKKADLLVLISEWVPPAIKRQYWDQVLTGQVYATDGGGAANHTGNNLLQQLPGTSTTHNERETDDDDDIYNLDNSLEPEEPLLATRVFDYD